MESWRVGEFNSALARLALASVAVAGAIYLVPASVQIVGWPSSGPVRVALLPPLSRLWWSLAGSLGLTAAVWASWSRSGRDPHRLASAVAPLALLLLWTLPFLPWLPDRAPLLLVLAGPLRWVVAGSAIARTLADLLAQPAPDRSVAATRSAVFAISLVLYIGLGLQFASDVGFGGDEPHYLVIAHSLLVDHDLDIANNHARRDYRAFFPGELRPDYLRRGTHDEIYSIHAPGLPAILLPAYAAAGAPGAVVMVALLAALTALAIFDLAVLITGPRAATLTWIAVCLTIPFVPHAWLIYPEVAGALVVAWSALWLWKAPAPPGQLMLRGVALALLPWLHTKFVVLLALLAVFLVARLWPRVKQIAALLTPIAISMLVWLYSFYRMYGVLDPQAPYGGSTRINMAVQNIPRGVLGLFLDQKFGLIAYSPVYALAIAGAWWMLRDSRSRAYALGLIIVALAFLVSTTRFYMWWGGASAPARFLVPIVPLFAPLVAIAIDRLRGTIGRSVAVMTLLASIGIAIASVASPHERFLFSDPHGVAELVRAVQGSAPLDASLPTFTDENWRGPLAVVAPWLLAVLVACVVTGALVRSAVIRSSFWAGVTGSVAFGLAASVLAGRGAPAERASATVRGQLALMDEYDPSRLRAVSYRSVRRLSDREVLDSATVSMQALAEPLELPEGRYEARLWFTGERAPTGGAFAALSDQVVVGRAAQPLANPAAIPFELPLSSPTWIGLTAPFEAAAVRRVDIVPLSLVPQSARSSFAIRRVERLDEKQPSYEQPSYLAYTDENTYAEGGVYWTRDTRKGSVAIVPAGASVLRLILHIGPNAGRVSIDIGATHQEIELTADETREMTAPIPPATKWLPVVVQASQAFRPSEVDPTSDDRRRLGCQVRPRLEWRVE